MTVKELKEFIFENHLGAPALNWNAMLSMKKFELKRISNS